MRPIWRCFWYAAVYIAIPAAVCVTCIYGNAVIAVIAIACTWFLLRRMDAIQWRKSRVDFYLRGLPGLVTAYREWTARRNSEPTCAPGLSTILEAEEVLSAIFYQEQVERLPLFLETASAALGVELPL